MSEPELPPLSTALALVLIGAPLFVLALRLARRLLPAVPVLPARWTLGEALLVLGAPFAAIALLALLLQEPGTLTALVANQAALGAGVGLALVFALRRGQGLWSLGLCMRPPTAAFVAVPLAYAPLFLGSLGLAFGWLHVCRARGWGESQEVMRMILDLRGSELVVAGFIAVVVGPLIEELFFRGFLLSALSQVVGERRALLYVSAVFAALHGLPGLPVLLALSLFLGWLQLRTRSIFVPWLAHALNNGVMLALALSAHGG
ncbi:MAG: CPBP family intramembrane metalloprotease [Planctomycetes bacterium]|nr:CPBP family intramembrane metalloprotease [Planctomycetota bacterium]